MLYTAMYQKVTERDLLTRAAQHANKAQNYASKLSQNRLMAWRNFQPGDMLPSCEIWWPGCSCVVEEDFLSMMYVF